MIIRDIVIQTQNDLKGFLIQGVDGESLFSSGYIYDEAHVVGQASSSYLVQEYIEVMQGSLYGLFDPIAMSYIIPVSYLEIFIVERHGLLIFICKNVDEKYEFFNSLGHKLVDEEYDMFEYMGYFDEPRYHLYMVKKFVGNMGAFEASIISLNGRVIYPLTVDIVLWSRYEKDRNIIVLQKKNPSYPLSSGQEIIYDLIRADGTVLRTDTYSFYQYNF
jgi:hypothetical protein